MKLKNRAELAIAQGYLTNSKRPTTFIEGVYPTHASFGKGARLFAEGKWYVDYCGALGSNLLGYGHPSIAVAIGNQYSQGSVLSLSSELEVRLAERLQGLFPAGERWKFMKSGTEACQAAIKMARAFTKRDLILNDGYHGWSDDFVSLSPPASGVPKRNWIKPFDWDLIKEAAAVIIEPVILDHSKDRRAFLFDLRDECSRHGTMLIFDEIITGFRVPKYSFANFWGVQPDLILLGKALGAGLPLSAVGGRKDVMNCDYFISGTFFGDTVAMAAAMTMIDIVSKDGSKWSMIELFDKGQNFLDKFNFLSPRLKITGYSSRGAFEGDELTKALFWQEACKAGILFGPSWFFNFPLMSYTDQTIAVCKDIFQRIEVGSVKLEGQLPKKPFAQVQREAKEAMSEARDKQTH